VDVSAAEVKKLQEETHFDKVEVKALYKTFTECATGGKLDRPAFKQALRPFLCFPLDHSKLESAGLRRMDDTPFPDRLFEVLDVNHDGTVDITEFISGLSFLCKGTVEEKLQLSFKVYDIDGNGFISKEEIQLMFKQAWMSGFMALSASHGNEELSMKELNDFAEEMGTLFADSAFSTLDTNGDGQLSLEEFKDFAMAEPKITATLNGYKKEVTITF